MTDERTRLTSLIAETDENTTLVEQQLAEFRRQQQEVPPLAGALASVVERGEQQLKSNAKRRQDLVEQLARLDA